MADPAVVAPTDPTDPRAPLPLTDLVVARLREAVPLEGCRYYGVLDFASARAKLHAPCFAVLPVADTAEPNLAPDPDGPVFQRVEAVVSVVAGVAAPNDLGGLKGTGRDGLSPLVAASRAMLMGWAPGGRFPSHVESGASPAERWTSLVFRRGRLLAIEQGRAWWQDEYSTTRRMRGHGDETEPPPQVRSRLCLVLNDNPAEEIELPDDGGA